MAYDHYVLDGYSGGYLIEFGHELKEQTICDLCFEPCDDFELTAISASLSIIVCRECLESDPVEFRSALDYERRKRVNLHEEHKAKHPKEFAKMLKDKEDYETEKLKNWNP